MIMRSDVSDLLLLENPKLYKNQRCYELSHIFTARKARPDSGSI